MQVIRHIRYSKTSALRAFFPAPRVWLILFLLLAWGLRLYHLDTMSLWWDESLSWDRAIHSIPTILANTIQIQNVTTRDLHPPLYFLLLHFSVLAAGTTEFALRFLSTCANVLTVAMLYPLARVLFPKRKFAALTTVLFAALAPFYVWYAQEARPYALVLLWSVLAVYALLRWLKTDPQTWRALAARWFVVFGLSVAATLTTHYLSFVLLPFFAATLVIFNSPARAWRARIASPATALAAVMLFGFAAILISLPRDTQDLASWEQVGATFVPLFIMLRDVWNSFAIGVTMNLDHAALLDLFLLAVWLVGVFSTLRVKPRDARIALFLVTYLFLPALALHLGSYLRPLYLNSRHLITTSPAFYIGLAVGVDAVARRIANRRRQRADGRWRLAYALITLTFMLPILAGALYSLNNLYFDKTFAKDDHKGWSQFLRERMRPDDYLLLVAPQAEKIVAYYAPPGLQWESLPHLGQTQDWQRFLDRESLLKAYRNHPRVWFLEIHQPVGDPKFAINTLLHRWGESVDIVYFPAIASRIILQQFVYHSAAAPKRATLPNPVALVYDGKLRLLGYDAPRQMGPGTRAAVKLYWRVTDKSPNDVSVSLRVTDKQGRVWGQWDAPPVGNLFPVSKWRIKTTLLDQHDLVVDPGAPPGKYDIEMRVYRAAGNEPLVGMDALTREKFEAFRLGELEVTRPHTPRDPSTLVIDQHTNVAFGSAVNFVGFDREAHASPGSAIPVTLYFQVTQNPGRNLTGKLELAAPWWQFWNRAQASAPFTLDLANREPGDIVQINTGVAAPGDAGAGTYTLRLTLDGFAPQTPFAWNNALTFGEATVDALTRSTDLPSIAHSFSARLGDKVEFLGYDLHAPKQLEPGARVKLVLYWRALKTMDTSYKVFTHLINSENRIFGQQDQEPRGGARPTTSWAPGEVFADAYEFEVASDAAPGMYQIEIGMYEPTTFTRLPTFDAHGNSTGDRILFGELRVE